MDALGIVKEQKATRVNNNQIVYNLFISNCTPEMETKLHDMDAWSNIYAKEDGLELIKLVGNATPSMAKQRKQCSIWYGQKN